MRLPLFLLLVVACVACAPPKGQVVSCDRKYLCSGDVVSETAPQLFCTDPNDAARAGQIKTYVKDFATTCGGLPVTCVDQSQADCVATCAAAADCDFPDGAPQAVRL